MSRTTERTTALLANHPRALTAALLTMAFLNTAMAVAAGGGAGTTGP